MCPPNNRNLCKYYSIKRKKSKTQIENSDRDNHAAAYHDISVVEDHGLADGQGADRFVEADLHPAVREDGGGAGDLFGLIPVLGGAADRLCGGVDGGPVEGVGDEQGGEQLLIAAQDHPVALHILRQHIGPAIEALAQPSALSDGIADGTGVVADDLAACIDEFALGVGLAGVLLQKAHIIPVRDEADILGILLFGGNEAIFRRNGADLVLAFKFAQGEAGVGKLLLGQEVEDIALILG